MDENNIPKILEHKNYFEGITEPFKDMRQAYAPLVWQCRYGGIEVPEQLWEYALSGRGKKYSANQSEDVIDDKEYMGKFANWVKNFEMFVAVKGKVQPGKYRAYACKQPLHFLSEIKNGLRALKLRFGKAPENSSAQKQMDLNLNRNTTFNPKKTEGKKLRS